MSSEYHVNLDRAGQVGFVKRAYRDVFVHEDGRRGLTQDELLRRMGQVDPSYARRYSHATVSRWETGATRPLADRLQVFGTALGLSGVEVEGLLAMAGLSTTLPQVIQGPSVPRESEDDVAGRDKEAPDEERPALGRRSAGTCCAGFSWWGCASQLAPSPCLLPTGTSR